jgi:hypothetical protein
LSRNPRLEYAGLEAFEGDEKISDVFLTGSELLATLGEDDLEPTRMIHVLKEWLWTQPLVRRKGDEKDESMEVAL